MDGKKLGQGIGARKMAQLTGTPTLMARGGLLISEHPFQDAAVNTLFKCAAGAEAGIVFRLEKTGEGWKGVLVSIKDGEIADYAITFDSNGKELKREH